MTGRRRYGYVYGGTVTVSGERKVVDGTAWSLGPCDEVKLRAAAIRDIARSEGVPLAGLEITDFWYSEISTDAVHPAAGTAGADPFRPQHPCMGPDPFRPCDPDD